MFEIWSVGHKPFEQQRNAEVCNVYISNSIVYHDSY